MRLTAQEYRNMTGGHQRDRSRANRGKPFEDFLKFVHDSYQQKGIACVHKVPTEFLPIRGSNGKVCDCKVEHKSCVDYLGRYGPTPVAIEAKHTEDDRIRFDRVEDHQAAYLDDWIKDPQAVAIVIVSFSLRRFFAVPWPAWKAARDAWAAAPSRHKPATVPVEYQGDAWRTPGSASVSADEFPEEWEIRPGGATGLPYLEIIDRWRKKTNGQI
jgi:recombination protein U